MSIMRQTVLGGSGGLNTIQRVKDIGLGKQRNNESHSITYSGYTCTSFTLNPELQVVEPARWKVVKIMVVFFG